MATNEDWRDGFLFVGNQLSLDFLNTKPVVAGAPTEFLVDDQALSRWLMASNLLDHEKCRPVGADSELKALLEFRETYRAVVFDIESGRQPSPAFLHQLNVLLADHPFVDQVFLSNLGFSRQRHFEFRSPKDALGPILDSTVDLLTNTDWTRIRKCDNCVLHFLDTSKKGTRRWCSMHMCGNRSKVAAYAQRKRSQ